MTSRARVEVMGPVRVRPSPPLSAAAQSVIAYLAVHGPGRVGRERLAFTLWPDRPEERARRTLSDALYRLRAAADDGAPWLASDPDAVWLGDVDVDLWEFRARASETGTAAVDALALHRGPLADGLDDEWLDLSRLAHHEAMIGLAERAAESLAPSARRPVAERWVEIDPLSAAAHRCLVETLLVLDRTDAARRAIGRYEHVMLDLGIDVEAEVAQWHAVVRAAEQPDPVRPFVGRTSERGRLIRLLDESIKGHGRFAVVLGAPGIGKSRLLDELAGAARWRGVTVLRASVEEHEASTPFGPLDAAIAGAFDEFRVLRAQVELSPDVRRSLTRVVPSLDEEGPTDVSVADALSTALRWMARSEPLLVLLDDVQWAGEEAWSLLVRCASELVDLPVVLVVAARDGDELPPAARTSIGALDAAGSPVVHLTALTIGDIDELLRSHDIARADAHALHARSAGNPLVALVLAGESDAQRPDAQRPDAQRPDAERPDAERLDAVVRRRLARLTDGQDGHVAHGAHGARLPAGPGDTDVLRVLLLTAVLGRTVELDVVTAAAPAPVVVDALAAAERARLLVRRGGSLEFEHDLVRAAILDTVVDDDLRRSLHASALSAVAAVEPSDVLRLLGHAEGAGDARSAATYALAAGVDALDQSAHRTAAMRFARSLELGARLGDPHIRHLALSGRIRAFDRLAERDAQLADVTSLAELAARCDDATMRIDALRHEAEYRFAVGDYTSALDVAERALVATGTGSALTNRVAAELMRIASVALRELGRYDDSADVGRRATEAFATDGDEFGVATMTDVLGGIAWRSGDPALAAVLHQQAADRFAELGALVPQARALNNVGTAMWALGDDRGAEVVHERALAICRALEDRQGEGDNLDNLGGVAFVRGDYDAAIDLYRRALAIRRSANDPWGVSISLSNLGDAHRARGESPAALAFYDESLDVNRAAGVVRNEATTLQARGLALHDLGRLDEARLALEAAAAMHEDLGDRANLLQTWCGLLDAAVAAGDRDRVETLVVRLGGAVAPADRAMLRQEVEVCLSDALSWLGRRDEARTRAGHAFAAMEHALAGLTRHERAQRCRTLPVNVRTDRLVDVFGHREQVELARSDAPLGVALDERHRIIVVWTTERPDDDLYDDGAERRRHVLQRLAAEANAADALPTDDDLARACRVTRRTIQRDIDALREAGIDVPTRGRSSR